MKKIGLFLGISLLLLSLVLLSACDDSQDRYTVTFLDKDGAVLKAEIVAPSEAATAPTPPTVTGMVFEGWDSDFTCVMADMTVRPVYSSVKHTVRFVDHVGNLLKSESVLYGGAASAPLPPPVPDMVFEGWDGDFSCVTADVTVRAIYAAAQEHTVTFVDDAGVILKTEMVLHGTAATPPPPPVRADKVFDGWDQSFDAVKGDMTVTARYRAKKIFTVTYLDYSGRKLAEELVREGDDAVGAVTPQREGYRFDGWSSPLTDIRASKQVKAVYSLYAAENVFDISYEKKSGDAVTLTLSLVGDVRLAGAQGTLALPLGITNVKLKAFGETSASLWDDKVHFIFVSATDVTAPFALLELTFDSKEKAVTFALALEKALVFDENEKPVHFSVIGESVVLQ